MLVIAVGNGVGNRILAHKYKKPCNHFGYRVSCLAEKEGFEPSLRSSRTMPLAETAKLLETLEKLRECWELVGSRFFPVILPFQYQLQSYS